MSRYLQGKLTQNCTGDIVFDNRIVPKYCCKKLLFFQYLLYGNTHNIRNYLLMWLPLIHLVNKVSHKHLVQFNNLTIIYREHAIPLTYMQITNMAISIYDMEGIQRVSSTGGCMPVTKGKIMKLAFENYIK